MSDCWTAACCAVGDVMAGWLLALPRDIAWGLLAVGSAAFLLAIRRWGTNQELLRRIGNDQRQLRRLVRQSRAAGDRLSLARYRRTAVAAAGLRFRQEFSQLLLSTLPLAMLATWAAERLAYLPIEPTESLEFVAWLPASAVGDVVHLVPSDGLEAAPGWVREVALAHRDGAPCGVAAWTLGGLEHAVVPVLIVRFRGQSVEHPLRLGQSVLPPTHCVHGDDFKTVVELREYRPLGIGRWRLWPLPPWLTAYTVLVLAVYLVGKRLLRIA